jgi:hypothetical protein
MDDETSDSGGSAGFGRVEVRVTVIRGRDSRLADAITQLVNFNSPEDRQKFRDGILMHMILPYRDEMLDAMTHRFRNTLLEG